MTASVGRLRVRAAIVHDWFQGYHGAERTVDVMRTDLFGATNPPDIFTFHAAHELLPPGLSKAIVKESRLAALPGIRQRGHDPGRWRNLLPLMPHHFRSLDLSEYDLVISSSHACAVNVRPRPDALHVCYCYTPMRYAWMPQTDAARVRGIRRLALRTVTKRLRRLDLEASRGPDLYIAISRAVRERIRRFYGRDAVVLHPPVDLDDLRADGQKEPDMFLWVGRLVAYKRPLLVAEAFRGLPYRLTMVGVGPLEDELRTSLPSNVELQGWIPRAKLVDLYSRTSGFIHAGEEDFGIAMVEALGSGTPVIALDRGGAQDIVRHDVDGLLVKHADVGLLRSAIEELGSRSFDAEALQARARRFSRERFVGDLLAEIRNARRRNQA